MAERSVASPALGERYRLGDLIARGGMADVYRAHDEILDRPVAVKILRTAATTGVERGRFTREATMLAKLNHPGLVTVLDAGLDSDRPYLVLEFSDGPSLRQIAPAHPDRVADLGVQLADALGYVHQRGVVHRDIKPGNVLLGPGGRVLLTDFGIARIIADTAVHTDAGCVLGTGPYLAPEQVRGQAATTASDVYSLGLVLIEALTGRRAYSGAPEEAALARLHRRPAVPASLPVTWLRLLTRMTDPDPRGRPTASEAATALRLMRQGGVDTGPLGATTGPRSTTKRARLLLVAALAAAIAVSISAVGLGRTSPGGTLRGAPVPPDAPPPGAGSHPSSAPAAVQPVPLTTAVYPTSASGWGNRLPAAWRPVVPTTPPPQVESRPPAIPRALPARAVPTPAKVVSSHSTRAPRHARDVRKKHRTPRHGGHRNSHG